MTFNLAEVSIQDDFDYRMIFILLIIGLYTKK